VMRTNYVISDFQQTYFVIESFEKLLDAGYQDFGPIYDRLRGASDFAPYELAPGDRILSSGDFHYFRGKQSAYANPRRS
jgi:phenylalanine-4-hydroxylase